VGGLVVGYIKGQATAELKIVIECYQVKFIGVVVSKLILRLASMMMTSFMTERVGDEDCVPAPMSEVEMFMVGAEHLRKFVWLIQQTVVFPSLVDRVFDIGSGVLVVTAFTSMGLVNN